MIQSMMQSFEDPHSRHALLAHFPIVLGALGLIPVAVLAAMKFKCRRVSAICVVWFLGAMVSLGLASGAGEEAYERVEASQPPLTQAEHDALEAHEDLGEGAWLWALPAVVLAGATLVPKKPVRLAAGAGLVAAAAVLTGFVAVTGHTGGKLVYDFGLGVPARGGAALPGQENVPSVRPSRDEDAEDHED